MISCMGTSKGGEVPRYRLTAYDFLSVPVHGTNNMKINPSNLFTLDHRFLPTFPPWTNHQSNFELSEQLTWSPTDTQLFILCIIFRTQFDRKEGNGKKNRERFLHLSQLNSLLMMAFYVEKVFRVFISAKKLGTDSQLLTLLFIRVTEYMR